jgi:acetoin utilization deacetylase AcuC-like enzyme
MMCHTVGCRPGLAWRQDVDAVGARRGEYHAVNVPLREGCRDATFTAVFDRVARAAVDAYQARAGPGTLLL